MYFKSSILLILLVLTLTTQGGAEGLWPVPEYAGDLQNREALTGDWGGTRTELANKGITLSVDNVTTYQSILDGGRDEVDEIGGSLDYEIHLDFEKMGLWPGAFVRIFAETQYGNFCQWQYRRCLGINHRWSFPPC